ncbi:hypothetical protein ACPCHT_39105 [Nucisporomicrobium flavum]|uniref:hypothetical protein n=1 Tax=Nucisporomicrobium flavum TaxID=2785915 RepID=UPI003C2BAB40
MTSDELMNIIGHLVEAYQNSTAHRVAASYETDYDERGVQLANQQQWDEIAAHRLREVDRAVRAAFPAQATVEGFMPVRALPDGKVELRAIDTASRPVAVLFTGTEALNLGGRLTACGAVTLDRIGLKPDTELRPDSGSPVSGGPACASPAIGTAPVLPPVVPGPATGAHQR